MSARLRLLFGRERSPLRRLPWLHAHLRRRYLRGACAAVRISDDVILCRVLGHYKLHVPAADADITPHLVLDGLWEQRVTEVIADRLRQGDTAIDVGANVGYFTMLMAGLVGPDGRVLAFEPHPATAALLRRSLRVNPVSHRVDAHYLPLAERDGDEVAMLTPENLLGSAHLAAADYPGALPVAPTRRLDGVPGTLDAVLVKIDAEGSEERIWAGMAAMLAGPRLRFVVIEFSRPSYRDPAAMLANAAAHGFVFRTLHGDPRLRRVTADEILSGPVQQMLLFER